MHKKILIIISILIFLAACESQFVEYDIIGSGKVQSISNNEPIILDIVGTSNTITVIEGTTIESISITGNGNKVLIPKGTTPEIEDVGTDNTITYY